MYMKIKFKNFVCQELFQMKKLFLIVNTRKVKSVIFTINYNLGYLNYYLIDPCIKKSSGMHLFIFIIILLSIFILSIFYYRWKVYFLILY